MHAAHWRLVVPWQAVVWYVDPAEHVVHAAHWRLAVAVHADVWYCTPEQELHAAHSRLLDSPPPWQARLSYCDAEQAKQV